jgi:hypothetical protein
MKISNRLVGVLLSGTVWISICSGCLAQTSSSTTETPRKAETLDERVKRGEPNAFKEAADQGRRDLIPLIERFADSGNPADGSRIWTRAALAKLGVKQYLDETVTELTTTNSALYRSYRASDAFHGTPPREADRVAVYETQQKAFEKLAYIKARSTVKLVVPFVYAEENPEDYIHSGGSDVVVDQPPSELAMWTLAQIVDNPPATSPLKTNLTHNARVEIWQQWWEQNKDKYP